MGSGHVLACYCNPKKLRAPQIKKDKIANAVKMIAPLRAVADISSTVASATATRVFQRRAVAAVSAFAGGSSKI
jgi:hypothetical protein